MSWSRRLGLIGIVAIAVIAAMAMVSTSVPQVTADESFPGATINVSGAIYVEQAVLHWVGPAIVATTQAPIDVALSGRTHLDDKYLAASSLRSSTSRFTTAPDTVWSSRRSDFVRRL